MGPEALRFQRLPCPGRRIPDPEGLPGRPAPPPAPTHWETLPEGGSGSSVPVTAPLQASAHSIRTTSRIMPAGSRRLRVCPRASDTADGAPILLLAAASRHVRRPPGPGSWAGPKATAYEMQQGLQGRGSGGRRSLPGQRVKAEEPRQGRGLD